jgi:hypothetical protein
MATGDKAKLPESVDRELEHYGGHDPATGCGLMAALAMSFWAGVILTAVGFLWGPLALVAAVAILIGAGGLLLWRLA